MELDNNIQTEGLELSSGEERGMEGEEKDEEEEPEVSTAMESRVTKLEEGMKEIKEIKDNVKCMFKTLSDLHEMMQNLSEPGAVRGGRRRDAVKRRRGGGGSGGGKRIGRGGDVDSSSEEELSEDDVKGARKSRKIAGKNGAAAGAKRGVRGWRAAGDQEIPVELVR